MPTTPCPTGCGRGRATGHYLCAVCWFALTPDTRRQLLRRGVGARQRLRQLYDQINAGTPPRRHPHPRIRRGEPAVIKAVGRDAAGQPVVILGLSGENVTRLMADEPILINLAELGLAPLRIAIIGGRTEETIAAQLAQHYGPLPTTPPERTRP